LPLPKGFRLSAHKGSRHAIVLTLPLLRLDLRLHRLGQEDGWYPRALHDGYLSILNISHSVPHEAPRHDVRGGSTVHGEEEKHRLPEPRIHESAPEVREGSRATEKASTTVTVDPNSAHLSVVVVSAVELR
jgi:hypothetical protein